MEGITDNIVATQQLETENSQIVTIETFINYITYCLKLGIFVNKGTENDVLLERCIKTYNKYKQFEFGGVLSKEDDTVIRKCYKRLNLILKVDNGLPINISDKNNQAKILSFEEHPAIKSGDLNEMLTYLKKHPVDILTNIPLTFLLSGKQKQLVWLYTRALFYTTQLIITETDPNADQTNSRIKLKNDLYEEALKTFAVVLTDIENYKETNELNKAMALDSFLSSKLVKSGITKDGVDDAKNEVLEIFQKRGIKGNPVILKMINSIAGKLSNDEEFDSSNILQSMATLAQSVSNEVRDDLQDNPDDFHNTLESITDIFQEMMDDPEASAGMPEEFRNVVGIAKGINNGGNSANPDDEIRQELDKMIKAQGLNRDDFYKMINNEKGGLDFGKLQSVMSNL